jgi:hypothetical protein
MTGGTKIDNGKEEMIGINVAARMVKNKVARPFRKVEFQIHFGKGIVEHESMFDILREFCDEYGSIERLGKLLKIEGTGTWKTLTVADAQTGEIEIEKKFTKNGFGEIITDPAYSQYVDELLDAAMTHSQTKQVIDDETDKMEGKSE